MQGARPLAGENPYAGPVVQLWVDDTTNWLVPTIFAMGLLIASLGILGIVRNKWIRNRANGNDLSYAFVLSILSMATICLGFIASARELYAIFLQASLMNVTDSTIAKSPVADSLKPAIWSLEIALIGFIFALAMVVKWPLSRRQSIT